MNKRVKRLREAFFEVIPEVCPERARYFTESMKASEGEPIILRRAKAFYDVLDKMTVFVAPDELIAGNQASRPKASPIFPEYSYEWLEREFAGDPYFFDKRPADIFVYTDETKEEILEILNYWKGKTLYENFRKFLPAEINTAWDLGVIDDTWVTSAGLGNIIPDFDWILREGLNGVIAKARAELDKLDLTQPGAVSKKWFLEAAIKSNEAVINFSNRIAEECKKMASVETDPIRKSELQRMAINCASVPANGANSFWEALQSTWIILLTLHLEANGHAISLGRFDQYIYPYYKADMESGVIDGEKALEILEAFIIKTNELNKLRSWPDTSMFTGYHMAINLAIGGQTVDGKDAVNDLSYLVLQTCEDLRLPTPSVSMKVFKGTDSKFLLKALEVVQKHKGGQPAFYNDEAFMEILRNMGIAEEDLYSWAPVGCIEAHIPGKWDYAAKGPWLNVEKVLELTLNGGVDPKTGERIFETNKSLTDFGSTEEILEAFKKQIRHFIELQVATEHMSDEFHRMMDLNAFRSSLVHDCIERGLTLIEGGSIYSADGGPVAGTISAGDALAAIEYAVFKEKLLTAEQLQHALMTDFADETASPTGEEIRQLLLNRAPKFGNDDDEADKWSVAVADFIGSTYQNDCKNSRYGKGPIPCCYSYSQSPVTGNVAFGRAIGATPDGRKASSPVNNGISPANGAEKNGPTAAINSVGKMPSIWFQKGAIFNVRLSESTLLSPEGRERAASLIRVLFEKKGVQIQINVVDNRVLQDALERPEDYQDLMIRVSGYSTYFVPLDPGLKKDLIERVEFDL